MISITTPTPSTMSTFQSVTDLVKATSSPEQTKAFENRLRGTSIVRTLIRSRTSAGLTQRDVASKMGVSQGTVSKIENSLDADLSLGEIARYVSATDAPLTLRIGPPLSLVESVKDHALAMKRDLETLADLARQHEDDSEIPAKIAKFFGEAGFNLFAFLFGAAAKLPPAVREANSSILSVLGSQEDCGSDSPAHNEECPC